MWFINNQPHPRVLPVFCDSLYSKEECDDYRKNFFLYSKLIDHGAHYNHHELDENENAFQYMRISNCIDKLNKETFNYDISTVKLHYCSFDEKSIFPDTTPYLTLDQLTVKLAFLINLNDDYEGGMVTVGIREDHQAVLSSIEVGTLSLFPSFSTIQLKPPTSGRKDIILGYCYGSQFK